MHEHAGEIATDLREDAVVVRLRGEIDAALRDDAERALASAIAARAPVVLDLREVTFIDATGLAFLVRCHRACAGTGVPCALRHVPPRTRDLLALLGVEGLVRGDAHAGAAAARSASR